MNIEALIERKRGCGRGGCIKKSNEDQVRVSLTRETKRSQKVSVVFVIGLNLMTQMRWMIGDRVTIDFDCADSSLLIRRVSSDSKETSWMLTPRCEKGKGTSEAMKGNIMRSCFALTSTPKLLKAFGMDDRDEYIPDKTQTSSAGLKFRLPKQWTVLN